MAATAATSATRRRAPLGQRLRELAAALWQPQVSTAARERRDLLLLLAVIGLVVAPHMGHLPWWASAVLVVLWIWRVWLAVTQRALPGRLAMLPLLLAACVAVWLEHGTLVGRDAGVTFLLMLLALKLLELRARRDVFVVVFLAFFILLTQFLFGQDLLVAALTLAAVGLLFTVLVSVNMTDGDLPSSRKLRLVGLVFLKALPLTVALFLLFPRLSGPLWGTPGDGGGSRTGLSGTMTPGAIGRLLESDEIAFRVRFNGRTPLSDQMYWRGPVFAFYNGRTWTPRLSTNAPTVPIEVQIDPRSQVDYEVTMEPHQRDWLFTLEMAMGIDAPTLQPRVTADAQPLAGRLVTERVRYAARSYLEYELGKNENPLSLQEWLQLPPGFNPRTLEYAAELRRTVPGAQESRRADPDLVFAVLQRFRKDNYVYTLAPPLLGRHAVDEFLFDTKAGFCEHYASAFVTLMRALDIPARVVTGYQGGEFNPVDGFLTVRQADAHAWAEVWLSGRGWVRIDPTAAVAPERVQRSTRGASSAAEGAGLPLGERAFSLLRSLRFNWEAVQNAWNQWVLSYSPERQRSLLRTLGLSTDNQTLVAVFAVVVVSLLMILAAFSLRHRVERDPLGELLAEFRARLRRAGASAPDHEGPRALLARAEALDASSRGAARDILQAIERWRYSTAAQRRDGRALKKLRAAVRRFRPRRVIAST